MPSGAELIARAINAASHAVYSAGVRPIRYEADATGFLIGMAT